MSAGAVIIATGPSLTQADVDAAMMLDRRIYAVNDAYALCDHVDILYACDCEWWDHHIRNIPAYITCWTTNEDAAKKYELNHVPGKFPGTFDTSENGIVYGGNSGFQALNLAYAHGVRDVILLGFDMGQADNGKSHFFGDHPGALHKSSPYVSWVKHFHKAAPVIAAAGMKVVNASRQTKLECFPREFLL